jgi:hypothetical protein
MSSSRSHEMLSTNRPFAYTQYPPGILFLRETPSVLSFCRWIVKQRLDNVGSPPFQRAKEAVKQARSVLNDSDTLHPLPVDAMCDSR